MVGLSELLWEVKTDFPQLQRGSKEQAQGSEFETDSSFKCFESSKGGGPTRSKGEPNPI